ncbi:PQ-loop repeat-containing protein [Candidatus Babeliales bacterium]|nr:PQ-loop repeat-containing protein [Candidatus Babeliales bacterium]MCF7899226.1 PQ-loop repeat-containing protein [Candidatus Babeliales bacterium]
MQNIFLSNFAVFATWIAQILFFVGLIPQILLNYKLKSTSGLSELLLVGYLNGYIAYLYYTFCCNLPAAYKTIIPIATIAMLIMVFQRFYYVQKLDKKSYKILFFYFLNFLFAISVLPLAMNYKNIVGSFLGWIMAFIWATYQIPQIFKIFKNKTTFGYSFLLVSLIGIGDLVELTGALILNLPMPTILNALRGFLIYLIFCLQFWIFKKKK